MAIKNYIDIVTNDSIVKVEVIQAGEERDVSLKRFSMDDVMQAVQEVVGKIQEAIKDGLNQVNEIQIEMGVSFTVSSGKMLAVLVNGNTEANMKLTLSWKREENP